MATFIEMAGQAPSEADKAVARQSRTVALVIAGTMIVWLAAQWLGGRFDWPAGAAFLFDFGALAALAWSIYATNRIRRLRRAEASRG